MRRLIQLTFSNTSQTVALASAMSFGVQVVFALLMLRWFTPQEVGEFSVISQIAFFWMTLALAQTPLSLLVNHTQGAHHEARRHWRSSFWRWCAMTPLAWLALWASQLQVLPALWWVVSIALCQLSWGLAQSFVLRTGNTRQQLLVRVVPPVSSVLTAWAGSQLIEHTQWQDSALLLAALLGYGVGSLWLMPAWLRSTDDPSGKQALTLADQAQHEATSHQPQTDDRSTLLRFIHTFVDVLLTTTLIIVWQRLYGAQETGWLGALLRVLGFVPAVIHMAWAQVQLSQATQVSKRSLWLGLLGCLGLVGIGLVGLIALHMQWLDTQWHGIAHYVWPLVLWQGSACLSAAVSHRPFQTGAAKVYSMVCIGIAGLQLLCLIAPALLAIDVSPQTHLLSFAALSTLCLLSLAKWMHALR